MRTTKYLAALAALSMATAPALAAPSAAKLSVTGLTDSRASTAAGDANEAKGGFLIPAIAIIAIIVGVLIISDDSDSN
jgi:hypothetical protein